MSGQISRRDANALARRCTPAHNALRPSRIHHAQAADAVVGSGGPCEIKVVGLDVTHRVEMQVTPLADLSLCAGTELTRHCCWWVASAPDIAYVVLPWQGQQLADLEDRGRFGTFLHQISRFYLQYHRCARVAVLQWLASDECPPSQPPHHFVLMLSPHASSRDSYGKDSIFLHDPTAMAAVLQPELFTWAEGQIRCPCTWTSPASCLAHDP